MRCLWWPHWPLIIVIQLLAPSRLNQKIYVEALLSFKSTIGNSQHGSSSVARYPCLRPWRGVNIADKLRDRAIVSLLPGAHPNCPQGRVINLSPCSSMSSLVHVQTLTPLPVNFYKSRKARIAATVGGDVGVPTITSSPANHVNKPRNQRLAATVGGSVGATLLVVITVLLVYICLVRAKRFARKTSETQSSVPSSLVEWTRENGSPHAGAFSPNETQNHRQLTIVELELATSNFSHSNVIGEGGFGLVYKGLLQDGSIVAIKRRLHDPSQYFIHEVENIGRIHHRHLVKLIGYCQEGHQQLLVYDYLPNGNVGNHLYDNEGLPIGKLDIRQRLSIALGAAKGLEYLHSLAPPLLHMHFRTSNILLDENFTVKVSDFGLSKLLAEGNRAGTSLGIDCFLDPELRLSTEFSERSDVYSFGVFLLELMSGREAFCRNQSQPQWNLVAVAQAKDIHVLNSLVDKTLGDNAEVAMQQMMELALQCVDSSVRRPTMKRVVGELELIQERELGHPHTGLDEEIGVVTLGSELFK